MARSLLAALAAAAVVASHASATNLRTVRVSDLVARPLHSTVVLRSAPGGRPLVRVGSKSVFGGPIAFGVVAVRGPWLEVTSEKLRNGYYGWVERGVDAPSAPIRGR